MAVRFVFDAKVASVLTAGKRTADNPAGVQALVLNFSKDFEREQKGQVGKVAPSIRAKMHNGKIAKGHDHVLLPDNIAAGESLALTFNSAVVQQQIFGKGADVATTAPLKVQIVRGNRRRFDILKMDAVLTDEQKKPENFIGFADIELLANTTTVVPRAGGKPPVTSTTPVATPTATPAPVAETSAEPVVETIESEAESQVQSEQPDQEPVATEQSVESEIGHLAEDRENPEDAIPVDAAEAAVTEESSAIADIAPAQAEAVTSTEVDTAAETQQEVA